MMIDEPFVYLAVAEDRQFFTLLTNEMFYTICPSNMVLRKSSEENCLIALFTGNTEIAMKKCKRILLEEFEPVWIRSPDAKYWVYSLRKPTHVTLKCRPLGGSPLDEDETSDIWLNGTGVLSNTSTCYIYAETFKLLPHSLGRTMAGLNKTHIILPNIETIINPVEQELLQKHLNSTVHLQEVDDVIKELTRNKDRAELDITPVLENLRQSGLNPNTDMYWTIGISICIIIFTASCCYCYRKPILNWIRIMLRSVVRHRPIPQPRQQKAREAGQPVEYVSAVDNILPLNVVVHESSGRQRETEEEELRTTERAPTPFVVRGRVPAT
jgi:hypothetical protein